MEITSNVKGDNSEVDFFFMQLTREHFLPFIPCFFSGVDKVVFLDTGLASQHPSYALVRAEELLWSGI